MVPTLKHFDPVQPTAIFCEAIPHVGCILFKTLAEQFIGRKTVNCSAKL